MTQRHIDTMPGEADIVSVAALYRQYASRYSVLFATAYAIGGRRGRYPGRGFSGSFRAQTISRIATDTIYLTAFVPGYGSVTNPDTYIYAFDAQTGIQKWVTVKMRGYINGPLVVSGKVYVMAYDSIWYTLNPANGSIEAHKTLSNAGPVVINGVLYNITDTTLGVLNPDGSTKWSVPVAGKYPFIDDVQNGIIYVSGRGSGIYAYNATNGTFLWHYEGYLPQPNGQVMVTIVS